MQFERRRWEANDLHASSSLGEAQATIENLQQELNETRELASREQKELREKHESALNELKNRIAKLEELLSSKEENVFQQSIGLIQYLISF